MSFTIDSIAVLVGVPWTARGSDKDGWRVHQTIQHDSTVAPMTASPNVCTYSKTHCRATQALAKIVSLKSHCRSHFVVSRLTGAPTFHVCVGSARASVQLFHFRARPPHQHSKRHNHKGGGISIVITTAQLHCLCCCPCGCGC